MKGNEYLGYHPLPAAAGGFSFHQTSRMTCVDPCLLGQSEPGPGKMCLPRHFLTPDLCALDVSGDRSSAAWISFLRGPAVTPVPVSESTPAYAKLCPSRALGRGTLGLAM